MKHVPELVAAYAAMSPWARELLMDVAKDYAEKFPAPRKQVNLTLVQASCVRSQPAANLLHYGIDSLAPVIVRQAVDGEQA
jgi:hypothetical protein